MKRMLFVEKSRLKGETRENPLPRWANFGLRADLIKAPDVGRVSHREEPFLETGRIINLGRRDSA